MFMISMPKTFKVGDTAECRINGKPERLTWRDQDTLVIEPGDARKIISVSHDTDLIHFVCGAAGLGEDDFAWDGPILYEKEPEKRLVKQAAETLLGADPTGRKQENGSKPDVRQQTTTGNVTEVAPGGSLEDILKLATGEANKEAPHLTVPFYMPLALPMTFEDALTCISPSLRKQARTGAISLVALAHGQMAQPGEDPSQVQFVLFFDTDKDAPGYYIFDTINKEVETAVLMRGDGTRCLEPRPLPTTEAVAFWMGGFLGWSEKVPGLYRLRYAIIEKGVTKEGQAE